MPQPKPITLTQIAAEDYQGAGEPQPLVIVGGDITGIDPQAAIADLGATPASFADLAAARTAVNENRLKINAILAALRAAGVIAS